MPISRSSWPTIGQSFHRPQLYPRCHSWRLTLYLGSENKEWVLGWWGSRELNPSTYILTRWNLCTTIYPTLWTNWNACSLLTSFSPLQSTKPRSHQSRKGRSPLNSHTHCLLWARCIMLSVYGWLPWVCRPTIQGSKQPFWPLNQARIAYKKNTPQLADKV